MRNAITFLGAALMVAVAGSAAAQTSASIQANANVVPPISVGGEQDLSFGDVIPGFAKAVDPTDVDAGRYYISGAGNLEVSLDFGALPATLDHTTSASTLPITFGAGSAGHGADATTVSGTFDPGSVFTTDLNAGDLYVFLGGAVNPDPAQEAGTYEGTVTLSVAYTGN